MAMRAVPIKSALSTAVEQPATAAEQPATAAAPSMTNIELPKVDAAQGVAATSDSGDPPQQGGPQGLDRADAQETDSAQADNSKKRKADGEAQQSPEVATAVAGSMGKRRASPEAEVEAQAVTVWPCNEPAVQNLTCCLSIQKLGHLQNSAEIEACCCLLQYSVLYTCRCSAMTWSLMS